MSQTIDSVITVANRKHINVWKNTSRYLVEHIKSKEYRLIVPREDFLLFLSNTPNSFTVLCEDEIIDSSYMNYIKESLIISGIPHFRSGWIYQQFLKIEACARSSNKLLIWDADTIPIHDISFFDSKNRICNFYSQEDHKPYFISLFRILGLHKLAKYSFIAQSFPVLSYMVAHMINYIENRFSIGWKEAILSTFTKELGISPFSEYETMGNWILFKYPQMISSPRSNCFSWERHGTALFADSNNIKLFSKHSILNSNSFISFENWQSPYEAWSKSNLLIFLNFFFQSATKPKVALYGNISFIPDLAIRNIISQNTTTMEIFNTMNINSVSQTLFDLYLVTLDLSTTKLEQFLKHHDHERFILIYLINKTTTKLNHQRYINLCQHYKSEIYFFDNNYLLSCNPNK